MRAGAYHTSASALHPRSNPAHSALADTAPAWFRLLRGRAPGESAPRPTAAACSPPEHDRSGSDRKSISNFSCAYADDAPPFFQHISLIRTRSFLLPCHVAFCFCTCTRKHKNYTGFIRILVTVQLLMNSSGTFPNTGRHSLCLQSDSRFVRLLNSGRPAPRARPLRGSGARGAISAYLTGGRWSA